MVKVLLEMSIFSEKGHNDCGMGSMFTKIVIHFVRYAQILHNDQTSRSMALNFCLQQQAKLKCFRNITLVA